MSDTIAAISTALGVGAISIVRISGDKAIEIINKLFHEKDLSKAKTHTIHYGHIYDKNKMIDEVLVSIFRTPKTFTTEDIVEINCHGGINTTNTILSIVLSSGARLAEPGEFTKRAFLNGRIDLLEAEGIMDLIEAKTDKMRKLALNQVEGKSSKLIIELRKKVMNILINIEVNVDYPEYEDILIVTNEMLAKYILEIKEKLEKILLESQNGKIIKEGIKTVIIGRPNVGKSSVLNGLIDEEKAIVTDIPGTTRDIVEAQIQFNGIILNIADTAGIRSTDDCIEKIGVKKSLEELESADLVILVINSNEKISKKDIELLKIIKKKAHIIFINKNDLKANMNHNFGSEKLIYGNTIKKEGLDGLKEEIVRMFQIDKIEKSDFNYLSNARQISIIKQTLDVVKDIEKGIKDKVPTDIIATDIRRTWDLLGEMIGENYQEDILDELFKQFCLGK